MTVLPGSENGVALGGTDILEAVLTRNAWRKAACLPLLDVAEECGRALYNQADSAHRSEMAKYQKVRWRIQEIAQREHSREHGRRLSGWAGHMALGASCRPHFDAFLARRGIVPPSHAACMAEGRALALGGGRALENGARSRPALTSLLPPDSVHACVMDGHGTVVPVWRDPELSGCAAALAAETHDAAGLRAIAADRTLLLWQATSLSHAAMVTRLGIDGIRLRLQCGLVLVHQEACAFPEYVPWVRGLQAVPDMEERRSVLASWLRGLAPLAALYPDGFEVGWYM